MTNNSGLNMAIVPKIIRLTKKTTLSESLTRDAKKESNEAENQLNLSFSELTFDVSVYLNLEEIISLIEKCRHKNQKKIILDIGVDEAGRGPLLGSVLVGAVILPPKLSGEFANMDLTNTAINQLNDSKKISEKKRDKLYSEIESVVLAYASVDIPPQIIDEINILQASLLGMKVATQNLIEQLSHNLNKEQLSNMTIRALFDGNKLPSMDYAFMQELGVNFTADNVTAVIKGDAKFTSIAMASIVAKVERDKQMYELAKKYPQYGIERHKGYPTKVHFSRLEEQGVLAEHRRSFAPVRHCLDKNSLL